MARQNLPPKTRFPGKKLTPKIPNAWAHTSVPTLTRESPPDKDQSQLTL